VRQGSRAGAQHVRCDADRYLDGDHAVLQKVVDAVVQEVSATTVAQEALRQLHEMADMKGVQIHIAETLPSLIVDVGRLELTFVNLLSNAIKYSDAGKADRIIEVIGGSQSEDECELIVRDNGIGIPDDRIGSIFERFSRAHADRDDLFGVSGVGLGLSIVADCVHVMGGRVEVESKENVGSSFKITLPKTPPGLHSGAEAAEL